MATNVRDYSGATDAQKLQNALNTGALDGSGMVEIVAGDTVIMDANVTYNNRNVSLVGAGKLKTNNGSYLSLQNFNSIRDITSEGVQFNLLIGANAANSLISNIDFLNTKTFDRAAIYAGHSRNIIANTTGLIIEDCLFDNCCGMWGTAFSMRAAISGYFDGATIRRNEYRDPSINDSVDAFMEIGGSNNLIEYNTSYGSNLYTARHINLNPNRYGFEIPLICCENNIVRHNTIYNCLEEAIGFDAVSSTVKTGQVIAVNGNQITVSWSIAEPSECSADNYTNFVISCIYGNHVGNYYKIAAHNGNTFTVSDYSGGFVVGDWVTLHLAFINNEVTDNYFEFEDDVQRVSVAVSFFGNGHDNLIARNTILGSNYPLSIVYTVVPTIGGKHNPSFNNIIEDNYIERMRSTSMIGVRDYSYGNAGVPAYTYGFVVRGNETVDTIGGLWNSTHGAPLNPPPNLMIAWNRELVYYDNSFDEVTLQDNTYSEPQFSNPTITKVAESLQFDCDISKLIAVDTITFQYKVGIGAWVDMTAPILVGGNIYRSIVSYSTITDDAIFRATIDRDGQAYHSAEIVYILPRPAAFFVSDASIIGAQSMGDFMIGQWDGYATNHVFIPLYTTEDLAVFDEQGNLVALLDAAYDIVIDEVLNGAQTLEFSLLKDNNKWSEVKGERTIQYLAHTFVIEYTKDIRDESGKPTLHVRSVLNAIHDLNKVKNTTLNIDREIGANGLAVILEGTGWGVGNVSDS